MFTLSFSSLKKFQPEEKVPLLALGGLQKSRQKEFESTGKNSKEKLFSVWISYQLGVVIYPYGIIVCFPVSELFKLP